MSSTPQFTWDWSDLAFASKKPLRDLDPIFIPAPRELSPARFKQLIKQYLPQGNLLLGLAQEPYILGLENQPHFRTLALKSIKSIQDKVNTTKNKHKIYVLSYSQRDLPYILEKTTPKKVVLINGSWYHAFHLRPEFYTLAKYRLNYELISPFTDEAEAKAYADRFATEHPAPAPNRNHFCTEAEMLTLANDAAKQSFAYSEHQIGVALGRRTGTKYQPLATAHNRVVPYETYAMHHGASREQHFSPMNDLNHYDVNHAEVELLISAQKSKLDLADTTLFINLLPCPTCARMLSATGVAEFIYTEDHSSGYAIKVLEAAGKTVRRLVP